MPIDLREVVKTTRYPLEAFLFVQRGLDFTVRRKHGEAQPDAEPTSRHVTGQDLCHGLRDYAIRQYGLLARDVLRHWQVNHCNDFGRIVFALVDAGIMHKTDDDSLDDFQNVYDFAEAFASKLTLRENA